MFLCWSPWWWSAMQITSLSADEEEKQANTSKKVGNILSEMIKFRLEHYATVATRWLTVQEFNRHTDTRDKSNWVSFGTRNRAIASCAHQRFKPSIVLSDYLESLVIIGKWHNCIAFLVIARNSWLWINCIKFLKASAIRWDSMRTRYPPMKDNLFPRACAHGLQL